MKLSNSEKREIFASAWLSAGTASRIHGGKPSQYFAECLKTAYKNFSVIKKDNSKHTYKASVFIMNIFDGSIACGYSLHSYKQKNGKFYTTVSYFNENLESETVKAGSEKVDNVRGYFARQRLETICRAEAQLKMMSNNKNYSVEYMEF